MSSEFEHLVKEIPYEHTKLADEIIVYVKQVLGQKLRKNLYLTLTDHLSFAIDPQKNRIPLHNALLWETEKFYNKEYQIDLKALKMVKDRIGYHKVFLSY